MVGQFSTGWFEKNRASLGGWRMSQAAFTRMGSRQGSRKVDVGLRGTWLQPLAWSRRWLFSPPGIRPLRTGTVVRLTRTRRPGTCQMNSSVFTSFTRENRDPEQNSI